MDEQLNKLQQAQNARREMLAQFRSKQLQEMTLSSGIKIFVKDVTMTDLMLTGKLPDVMLDLAQDSAKDGAASMDLKKLAKSGAEFKSLMDTLVRLCVVEPPIADMGDDDHLGIDEISGDDKMAIFNWANREVEQLRPFREGEDELVAALQPGDGLPKKPKRNNGASN